MSLIENYEIFLESFDKILAELFENQKEYIKCKKGCCICCQQGDYPFSQLEFTYLTHGFLQLPNSQKQIVQSNIQKLLKKKENCPNNKRFEHVCPFLIDNQCCVYKYRGIICRTFGLCYYDDEKKYIRLPGCVHNGLNYAKVYDKKTGMLNIDSIPTTNLRINKVFESKQALDLKLDCGEIRPMLDWLILDNK